MADKKYSIKGKVIDRTSQLGIPGLRVEAWDKVEKDQLLDERVGSTVTDSKGTFHLEFSAAYFQEVFQDRKPDLYFKIFQDDQEIHSTEDGVIWNYESKDQVLIIEIEGQSEEAYLVSGYVRTTENIPVPGLVVEAFDKKVGKKPTSLSSVRTDEEGFFQIDYSDQLEQVVKAGHVDLFVQTYDADGERLDKSELLMDAPKNATLNLTVPKDIRRAPTAFEKLENQIGELVKGSDLSSLDHEDFEYIAAKQKLNIERVERFIHALKLEEQSSEHKKGAGIPAAVLYALIGDEGLPDLSSLANRNISSLERSIQQAVDNDVIPFELGEKIDGFISALKRIAVALATAKPADPDVYSIRNLIDILDDLPEKLGNSFIHDYTLNEQGKARFWEELAKNKKFDTHLKRLQDLFTLAELTQKNLPRIQQGFCWGQGYRPTGYDEAL